ncbi:polysaccharide pyruvyl transferase family protein [Xylanimonas oleitrophica]|uniref:Polysaccharide pyruvyl transferase family protein n=1 Tax=Xylanimonas oleitrophica TaxID=2607479 RepID=A0A2W5WS53_9MICO|nr:polysaccharide pyruvyl transferase family protein [Xylanimonas oleitrophica]PZR54339.1 polysaccharide pyruvyl transferase family protein [Xylanimonas oleitrophica]
MKRLFGAIKDELPGAVRRQGGGRTVYIVATSGHPNYGDEIILRRWLRLLAKTEPDATVWVDSPAPGPTAALMRDEHPGLRTTDTLYRLSWEAPSDDSREVAEFVRGALDDPGSAPRWIPGIEVLRGLGAGDVLHVVGGGYVNSVWPRHLGLVAGAAWVAERTRASVAVTGLGLLPADDAAREVWKNAARRIGVLTVRDQASLEVVRANPDAVVAPDDALLGGAAGLLARDAATAPDVMVCVQTDMLAVPFDDVVETVRSTLAGWGVTSGAQVGFVECIPRVDRAIYDALSDELPGARFYSLWEILRDGLPARPGQRWISSRYHPHLVAAAAGASGVALSVSEDYYAVKHGAVAALGSGWTQARVGDRGLVAGDAGSLPARAQDHGVRLLATARRIYAPHAR